MGDFSLESGWVMGDFSAGQMTDELCLADTLLK
jgi:hypothetical protein